MFDKLKRKQRSIPLKERLLLLKQRSIPPWEMPSDPVKALVWFMHWLMKVVIHFFWLAIIVMVILETYLNWSAGGSSNGLIAGSITLLIGLCIWAVLFGLLFLLNMWINVSRVISGMQQARQKIFDSHYSSYSPPFPQSEAEADNTIVEGSITDLEEERRRRARERE